MDINTVGILIVILMVLVVLLSPTTYKLIGNMLKMTKLNISKVSNEDKVEATQEIHSAIETLLENEKGATIVIDVRNEVHEYVTDSQPLDSIISSNLIINIFEGSKTPLHDGAVVIRNNRIAKASAYITKLSEQEVPKKFGTRHRSALGLSEVTKAIIIVLSEETNTIKMFHNSKWYDVPHKDLFNKIIELWK